MLKKICDFVEKKLVNIPSCREQLRKLHAFLTDTIDLIPDDAAFPFHAAYVKNIQSILDKYNTI